MAYNPVDLSAGDIGKLSPIEQARLIEELRLIRQLTTKFLKSSNAEGIAMSTLSEG